MEVCRIPKTREGGRHFFAFAGKVDVPAQERGFPAISNTCAIQFSSPEDEHRRVALLPFVQKRLRIQHFHGSVLHPSTIGEHLFDERLKRKHLQRDVAAIFGCGVDTINRWERNKAVPTARFAGRVIAYLGFDPITEVRSFGDRLKTARRKLGLTQRELAAKLGTDQKSVSAWESGRTKPVKHWEELYRLLDRSDNPSALLQTGSDLETARDTMRRTKKLTGQKTSIG